MALQEKSRIEPADRLDTRPPLGPITDIHEQESVYVAKDVEPSNSPAVAREGQIVQRQPRMSPFVSGMIIVIGLFVLVYLLSLIF